MTITYNTKPMIYKDDWFLWEETRECVTGKNKNSISIKPFSCFYKTVLKFFETYGKTGKETNSMLKDNRRKKNNIFLLDGDGRRRFRLDTKHKDISYDPFSESHIKNIENIQRWCYNAFANGEINIKDYEKDILKFKNKLKKRTVSYKNRC